jgi:hypothetical protein
MSQRVSGYERQARENYPTPASAVWPLVPCLRPYVSTVWEPAPTENGQSEIASTLRAAGFRVITTDDDFLHRTALPDSGIEAIVTNPPFGRQGKTAVAFIERALRLAPVMVRCSLKSILIPAKHGNICLVGARPSPERSPFWIALSGSPATTVFASSPATTTVGSSGTRSIAGRR